MLRLGGCRYLTVSFQFVVLTHKHHRWVAPLLVKLHLLQSQVLHQSLKSKVARGPSVVFQVHLSVMTEVIH